MLSFGPLGFAAPLALLGLIALPAVWWLLRATPPPPNRVAFPPLRLLLGVLPDEETPNRTPLWLVIFRMLVAALIILGLARPILFPRQNAAEAPLLLVVDDGWAAARNWSAITGQGRAYIADAQRAGETVTLVFTAGRGGEADVIPVSPGEARRRLDAREPSPWPANREAAAARIASADLPGQYNAVYLSSGLAGGAEPLIAAMRARATLGQPEIHAPSAARAPLGLRPPETTASGFRATVIRPAGGAEGEGEVEALTADGRLLASAAYLFEEDATEAIADFRLPGEIRRRVALLRVPGAPSAGSASVLDDRWNRPLAGLVSQGAEEESQPLLSDLFYLEKALSPSAEVQRGALEALLEVKPGLIVLPDGARLDDPARLADFVREGGVLVRFAGPRLSAAQDQTLLPVRIRAGGRSLGGALAWDEPQSLAAFPESSPFAGLVPGEDITVSRQVLAEPEPDLGYKSWARLEDGTPLVTAERLGQGWIVLFHVTASPEWSNLPLSKVFLDMLDRVASLATAGAAAESGAGPWRLERAMTASGRLAGPDAEARPVAPDAWPPAQASADHPPGLYRRGAEAGALNVIGSGGTLSPLPRFQGVRQDDYGERASQRWGGALLTLALVLLALDALVGLAFSGRLRTLTRRLRRAAPGTAGALLGAALLLGAPGSGLAQEPSGAPLSDKAMEAALEMRLAYVRTGDAEIDTMSEAGLRGLSRILTQRTAIEPAEPAGVDIASDNILVYPMLYWPVRESEQPLTESEAAKLDAYLKSGGMVVFDTRDAGSAVTRQGAHPGLQSLLSTLDVPPLMPAPDDHVLTKSFYLLDSFPGRWPDGRVYVESDASADRDGVSSLVVGSNDWAAAWAMDQQGRPMAAIGSDNPRQREFAYRFGVNLMMYVLTGNYKSDQVHVPALLERLGE